MNRSASRKSLTRWIGRRSLLRQSLSVKKQSGSKMKCERSASKRKICAASSSKRKIDSVKRNYQKMKPPALPNWPRMKRKGRLVLIEWRTPASSKLQKRRRSEWRRSELRRNGDLRLSELRRSRDSNLSESRKNRDLSLLGLRRSVDSKFSELRRSADSRFSGLKKKLVYARLRRSSRLVLPMTRPNVRLSWPRRSDEHARKKLASFVSNSRSKRRRPV